MQQFVPIFAAGWQETLFGVIVFILYGIGHLITEKGKKRQAPPKAPLPRGELAPRQQPRTLEEKLRTEVEQFLRQAKGEEPRRPEAKRPVVIVQKPAALSQTAMKQAPHESVQEHVSKHMSTRDVTRDVASLGAEVGHADEKMTAHLQERFQHRLGALEPRQTATVQQPKQNTAAKEFVQLLRSPNGMRQVIIASEILRRPEI